MLSYSEFDNSGGVDSFRSILPNKKISEDITRGRFEYNKPKRDYNELEKPQTADKSKTRGDCAEPYYKSKHVNVFALFVSIVFIGILVAIASMTFCETVRYTTFFKSFGAEKTNDNKTEPYKAMCVIEQNSGREIMGLNAEDKLCQASTTKIMTLIVALENISDYEAVVTIPDSAVGIEGTSTYLRRGENLKIIDLMYGLMLASGNDNAVALAIITSGSEENFVKLMNEYAKKLNLTNTHFDNPHGLHGSTHYTSALDLAKLTAYAMKNEIFRKIVSTKRYTVDETNCTKTKRYLKNKQKLLFDDNLTNSGFVATGVKSGFTPEAGRCLVTSATINGKELIAVVLNCPDMFNESERVLKEAEAKIENKRIIEAYSFISNLPVENSKTTSVKVYTKAGFVYPILKSGEDKINVNVNLPEKLVAPVTKDQVVGSISVTLNGNEIFKADLYSLEDAPSITTMDIFKDITKQFVA